MVYSLYHPFMWLGGWFIIAIPTLQTMVVTAHFPKLGEARKSSRRSTFEGQTIFPFVFVRPACLQLKDPPDYTLPNQLPRLLSRNISFAGYIVKFYPDLGNLRSSTAISFWLNPHLSHGRPSASRVMPVLPGAPVGVPRPMGASLLGEIGMTIQCLGGSDPERLGYPYSLYIPYSMGSRLELLRVSQSSNRLTMVHWNSWFTY